MSIRRKMILILLAVAIIPMVFVGWWGFINARSSLESAQVDALKSVADLKAKKIEDFFAEAKKNVIAILEHPNTKRDISILAGFSDDTSSPAYKAIKAELDSELKGRQQFYEFKNVLVFNRKREPFYALHRNRSLKNLSNAFSSVSGKTPDEAKRRVGLSDIFMSSAKAHQFSILVRAPVRDLEGSFAGVIAFEVDMAPVYELIQERTGLGETGETLIAKRAGDVAIFLNPLRHDPNAALQRKAVFGEKQAIPIQEALNGRDGSGLSIDYRGEQVIAVWRYIPSLDWGMVAKIDVSEAFSSATALRDFLFILVVAVAFAVMIVALVASKSIADPIQSLQKGVEAVGRGNLEHKVGTHAKDEIGQLSKAFDRMTENLKAITASRDELEKEINERKKVEEALQKRMTELRKRVKELNCLFDLSNLVESQQISLEGILRRTAELIAPAWKYPEIACARIILEGQEFKTLNFKETRWMQVSKVIVYGEQKGSVEVAYLEERPESDEGPFLKEERSLINAIAERLGRIIERKRAERALIEGEETLREAQEIAHLGNWEYDIGEDRITFSDELYRIYGVKPSDLPLTYEKLLEYAHEEDREYHNTVAELLRKEGAGEFEYRVLRPHGNMRWVWGRGQVTYDKAGVPLRMFGTVQDITGRKRAEKALRESEKRFRDLIENSVVGISITQDDQVVYQNPEHERILGPLPRPRKLTDFESIHPDDIKEVKEFNENITSGKVKTYETEFRFYPLDEAGNRLDMKWVHCRATSIEYRGKEAVLVNMMDVTRAKELENILRIQDKMSSLGRVSAGIAHEIRNPLSGINIYLATLEKMYGREGNLEKVKQIFDQLKSASNKIESVIRRVMDFSKPSEPKLVLTDINRPIEEAVNLSSVTLRKRGIKLEKALAEGMQPCRADPHLIEQVILNLITNAAEAMKNVDGAKVIEVTSSMENNLVTVRISDSGPGIPSHLREKIFDPFYTTKNGSTGIGLSLSHRIITDHGGSLKVYPSKRGGAEFRIEIPIEQPEA